MPNTEPRLVSVIIPCHNDADRLPIALASVFAQKTSLAIECLVIEDAAPKSLKPICDQYGARYFRGDWHNANDARNFGLTQARGEIICFFDADNYMNVDFINELAQPILNGEADVVYSHRTLIGEGGYYRFDYFNHFWVRHEDLKMGAQIDTPCLIRRSILRPNPWWPDLNRGQDWDFHLSLLEQGARYHLIDKHLWRYWLTPASSDKYIDRDRHYLTSHTAVRRRHRLAVTGTAPITIALFLESNRQEIIDRLKRALALLELHKIANLHIVFSNPTDQLYSEVIMPWLHKHRLRFSGALVTLDVDEGRTADHRLVRALELHLEHTTTKQIIIIGQEDCPVDWLRQPRAVNTQQLRSVHLLSSPQVRYRQLTAVSNESADEYAPRTIIVVSDLQSATELEAIIEQTRSYERETRLVLFARDQEGHRRLRAASLPGGSWLPAWTENRARIMNQLLNEDAEMMIVTTANCWPTPWLIPVTYGQIRVTAVLSGEMAWRNARIETLRYDPTLAVVEHGDLEKPRHLPLLNPYLFALNLRKIPQPLFEPRLDQNWPTLLLDASFRLARLGIPIKHSPLFGGTIPRLTTDLPQPDAFLMGRCFGLNTPWRQAARWCWYGSGRQERRARLNGWIQDCLDRRRIPDKRRLWRPL